MVCSLVRASMVNTTSKESKTTGRSFRSLCIENYKPASLNGLVLFQRQWIVSTYPACSVCLEPPGSSLRAGNGHPPTPASHGQGPVWCVVRSLSPRASLPAIETVPPHDILLFVDTISVLLFTVAARYWSPAAAGQSQRSERTGQQSNTNQQYALRNLWSSSTSSRISPGSCARCHWHSSRPASIRSSSGAAARAALIA